MIRSSEEILIDIDQTLDQLIINAKIIQKIELDQLQISELEALQKTQESLLARLIDMNDLLKVQKKKVSAAAKMQVEKKIEKFARSKRRKLAKSAL